MERSNKDHQSGRQGKATPFTPDFDVNKARDENDRRLKSTFESIFKKYGRDFEGIADEIDLETGEIVVDHGHVQGLSKIGNKDNLWASTSASQSRKAVKPASSNKTLHPSKSQKLGPSLSKRRHSFPKRKTVSSFRKTIDSSKAADVFDASDDELHAGHFVTTPGRSARPPPCSTSSSKSVLIRGVAQIHEPGNSVGVSDSKNTSSHFFENRGHSQRRSFTPLKVSESRERSQIRSIVTKATSTAKYVPDASGISEDELSDNLESLKIKHPAATARPGKRTHDHFPEDELEISLPLREAKRSKTNSVSPWLPQTTPQKLRHMRQHASAGVEQPLLQTKDGRRRTNSKDAQAQRLRIRDRSPWQEARPLSEGRTTRPSGRRLSLTETSSRRPSSVLPYGNNQRFVGFDFLVGELSFEKKALNKTTSEELPTHSPRVELAIPPKDSSTEQLEVDDNGLLSGSVRVQLEPDSVIEDSQQSSDDQLTPFSLHDNEAYSPSAKSEESRSALTRSLRRSSTTQYAEKASKPRASLSRALTPRTQIRFRSSSLPAPPSRLSLSAFIDDMSDDELAL